MSGVNFMLAPPPQTVAAGTADDKWSQASLRSQRIWRDQHGREYESTIENKTQCPVGPLMPRFSAPLMPDERFVRIINPVEGKIWIDYKAWVRQLQESHRYWKQKLYQAARTMFGTGAIDAINRKDPLLYNEVGDKPRPVPPVVAAAHGNPWVLGTPGAKMPDQLRPYFADALPEEDDPELSTDWYEPEPAGAPPATYTPAHAPAPTEPPEIAEDEELPQYPIYCGGNKWLFSDGVIRQHTRAAAKAIQAAIDSGSTYRAARATIDENEAAATADTGANNG